MKKKNRPVSRKFWSYLNYLPQGLQARFIRSMFDVDYTLPNELVLKQAETEDEISQALQLVHDSYVELNYMDPDESKMRFSKYHAHPGTVILVAKYDDEVIGTISIIPDSSLGLPSDTTWDLSAYRSKGKLLAEISSLAIKKSFRMRRGKLLLPLCKIMFTYCEEILKLDGIVIATTLEVEPFYLNVLLFEKVVKKTGQRHKLVKDNPSSCCYLTVNKDTAEAYKKVYNSKPLNKNLYHFFKVAHTPNIQLPSQKVALQTYNLKGNESKVGLINKHPSLLEAFTETEKFILQNLHLDKASKLNSDSNVSNVHKKRDQTRFEVRLSAWCIFLNDPTPIECQLVDVSDNGFHINLKNTDRKTQVDENFVFVLKFQDKILHCRSTVRWTKLDTRLGCLLLDGSEEWKKLLMHAIHQEMSAANVMQFPSKKVS